MAETEKRWTVVCCDALVTSITIGKLPKLVGLHVTKPFSLIDMPDGAVGNRYDKLESSELT